MNISLNNHKDGYSLTFKEALTFAFLPPFSASVYAARHGECAKLLETEGKRAWGHRTLQMVEYIPVVGLLIAIIEKVAVLAYQKLFEEKAKEPPSKELSKHLDQRAVVPVANPLTPSQEAATHATLNGNLDQRAVVPVANPLTLSQEAATHATLNGKMPAKQLTFIILLNAVTNAKEIKWLRDNFVRINQWIVAKEAEVKSITKRVTTLKERLETLNAAILNNQIKIQELSRGERQTIMLDISYKPDDEIKLSSSLNPHTNTQHENTETVLAKNFKGTIEQRLSTRKGDILSFSSSKLSDQTEQKSTKLIVEGNQYKLVSSYDLSTQTIYHFELTFRGDGVLPSLKIYYMEDNVDFNEALIANTICEIKLHEKNQTQVAQELKIRLESLETLSNFLEAEKKSLDVIQHKLTDKEAMVKNVIVGLKESIAEKEATIRSSAESIAKLQERLNALNETIKEKTIRSRQLFDQQTELLNNNTPKNEEREKELEKSYIDLNCETRQHKEEQGVVAKELESSMETLKEESKNLKILTDDLKKITDELTPLELA